MAVHIGSRIGRYEIRALIGAGGMGEVYRAFDVELCRDVALKFLPPEVALGDGRLHRFLQEARALSALNHPNILTVYEVQEGPGGVHFFAAELVDGMTLRQRLAGGPVPVRDAIDIAVQVASALVAAHAQGVVHRDLKPENIMIRDDGYIKVLDFGLAKVVAPPRSHAEFATVPAVDTSPGTVMGTVAYMAPEQARGEAIDGRADLWSLGVVLYEMVAGHPPFKGASPSHTTVAILDQEPPPLSQYRADVPEALQDIVSDALTKDVDARLQNAKQMQSRLERLERRLHGAAEVVAAEPRDSAHGGPVYASRVLDPEAVRAAKTHRLSSDNTARRSAAAVANKQLGAGSPSASLGKQRRWVAAVLSLAILSAAGLWWLSRDRSETTATDVAVPPRVTPLTSDPGVERSPTFSPDGRQLAYVSSKFAPFDIFVQLIGAGEPLRLTATEEWEMSPAWSPDGRYIAFLRGRATPPGFYIMPALGGAERRVSEAYGWPLGGTMPQALDWLPDGRALAIVDKNSERDPWSIYLLTVETGERRRLTTPGDGWDGDQLVTVTNDGRSLAFVRARDPSNRTGHIYVLSIAEGEPVRLTSEEVNVHGLRWSSDGTQLLFSAARGGSSPTLWRIAADGASGPLQLPVPATDVRELDVAPKGDRLAYVQLSTDHNVSRMPLVPTDGGTRAAPAESFLASTRLERAPQFAPDGQRVSFRSDRSGRNEVWVAAMTGSRVMQVTNIGGGYEGPAAWSPDGLTLAFESDVGGSMDIYLVSAEGGASRRLTADPSRETTPSWSKDGQWIYFTSDRSGQSEVWRMRVAGAPAVQVTRGGGSHPAESPGGNVVYFVKGSPPRLWEASVDGTGPEVPAFDGVSPAFATSWWVVDRGLYFFTRPGTATFILKFLNSATRRVTDVATLTGVPGPFFVSFPTVSQDERWVVYEHRDRLDADLVLLENLR